MSCPLCTVGHPNEFLTEVAFQLERIKSILIPFLHFKELFEMDLEVEVKVAFLHSRIRLLGTLCGLSFA